MTDRDNADLSAWARRAFDGEPPATSISDDLARGRAALTRRRRWTTGTSGIAVSAVAFAIAMAPSVLPDPSEQQQPAGSIDQHRKSKAEPPKQPKAWPKGDGSEYYEQRRQLYRVAKDHLDPDGGHLGWASGVQTGGGTVGTRMDWRVPGEDGLGMVQVGIGEPGLSSTELRSEYVLCGDLYTCEPSELPDGSTAWVGQSDDGRLGVGYQQVDGDSVWVITDPLFGNNSTTPVSSVDVTVDQALRFVVDDRLEFLGGPPCTKVQKECLRIQRAERQAARSPRD